MKNHSLRLALAWMCCLFLVGGTDASEKVEIVPDRELRASLGQRLDNERLRLRGRLGLGVEIGLTELGHPISPFYVNSESAFGRRYRNGDRCFEVTLRSPTRAVNLARSVSCDPAAIDLRLPALPDHRRISFQELREHLPSTPTILLAESRIWTLDAYPFSEWNFQEDREVAQDRGIDLADLIRPFSVEFSRTVSVAWSEDRVLVVQRATWSSSKLGFLAARTWTREETLTLKENSDFAFIDGEGRIAFFRDVAGLPTAFWPWWFRAGTAPERRLDERAKIRIRETGTPGCFQNAPSVAGKNDCQSLIEEGGLFSGSPFDLLRINFDGRTIHVESTTD